MENYDHLDIEDVWDIIWTAYVLGKDGDLQNELEIYRKWIPILTEKLLQEKLI